MRKHTIAVLECDTPVPAVLDKLGNYGQIFEAFLRHGLDKYRQESGTEEVELRVIKSNMVDLGALPSPDEIDSVILTGSSKCRMCLGRVPGHRGRKGVMQREMHT